VSAHLAIRDGRDVLYAELSARNPRLVMVSMSGFGAEDSLAERPMYDNVVQLFPA